MSAAEIIKLLHAYLGCSLAGALYLGLTTRRRTWYATATVLFTCLVISSALLVDLDRRPPLHTLVDSIRTLDARSLLVVTSGAAAAATWLGARLLGQSAVRAGEVIPAERWPAVLFAACCAVAVTTALGLIAWDAQYDIQVTRPHVYHDSFEMRKVAQLQEPPARLAAGANGAVFTTIYNVNNKGGYSGTILRFEPGADPHVYRQRVVASSNMLYRPFGLTVASDALYVSRCGHASWATNGHVTNVPLGAVTCLKDFDSDGYFEYYDDVVRELPGASGPDTMHQNNGIAFDKRGNLYIAVGANSNRELDEHPWAGTVLKVEPGQESPTVLARGFRNPFGIAVNRAGDVFVTDNDTSDNAGDELNYVVEGAHYGHPYVVPNEEGRIADGFREPILLSDKSSNFGGIAFAESDRIPEDIRGSLLICDMGSNQILSVELKREGDKYVCKKTRVLARVHSPVDIAVSDEGCIYVASRYYQTVYAITPRRGTALYDDKHK